MSPPVEVTPGARSPTAADFPGCKPVRLPRQELDDCEMRLEYWDAATESAWICDPVSSCHGGPTQRLGRLAERIAAVRGGPMECFGSTDLTERDAHGEPRLIMQADQSVYLHPARARLPRPVLTIGEHDFPDVVLEVDHTTDARRRKLPQYEAWGFPEVWIEVPDARAPSRPRSRRSGLTIHLLEDGAYRQAARGIEVSAGFPGVPGFAELPRHAIVAARQRLRQRGRLPEASAQPVVGVQTNPSPSPPSACSSVLHLPAPAAVRRPRTSASVPLPASWSQGRCA